MSNQYTVAQLEKILQKRRIELQRVIQQRNRLRKKLSQLEQRIIQISGAVPEELKSARKRPKNAKTLLQAVTETLAKHKQGLRLKDLANKVLASGYKTSSTDFPNTLYQSLYHNSDKLVHDAKAHTYRLKSVTCPQRP